MLEIGVSNEIINANFIFKFICWQNFKTIWSAFHYLNIKRCRKILNQYHKCNWNILAFNLLTLNTWKLIHYFRFLKRFTLLKCHFQRLNSLTVRLDTSNSYWCDHQFRWFETQKVCMLTIIGKLMPSKLFWQTYV